MRKMVGFRNIAVHEYEALNPEILRSIINTKLADFEGLIGSVSRNLGINTLSGVVPISFDGTKVASFSLKRLSITGDDLGKDYTVSLSLPDHKFSYPIEIQTANDTWDLGTFPVCLPDFQHKEGRNYSAKAKHADTCIAFLFKILSFFLF